MYIYITFLYKKKKKKIYFFGAIKKKIPVLKPWKEIFLFECSYIASPLKNFFLIKIYDKIYKKNHLH